LTRLLDSGYTALENRLRFGIKPLWEMP
jgi:hypothetical protein